MQGGTRTWKLFLLLKCAVSLHQANGLSNPKNGQVRDGLLRRG